MVGPPALVLFPFFYFYSTPFASALPSGDLPPPKKKHTKEREKKEVNCLLVF